MEFKCDTCIIFGYLHSPWNLEGYCITITKPRVPSKTFFGLTLKQDVFYEKKNFCSSIIDYNQDAKMNLLRKKAKQQQCSKNTLTLFILMVAGRPFEFLLGRDYFACIDL
jgi:hypothetical protein